MSREMMSRESILYPVGVLVTVPSRYCGARTRLASALASPGARASLGGYPDEIRLVLMSALGTTTRSRVLVCFCSCLLYTSDAADDLLCVDLGGRRIIKKKKE